MLDLEVLILEMKFDSATRLRFKQLLGNYLDDLDKGSEDRFIDKVEEFLLIPKDKREAGNNGSS